MSLREQVIYLVILLGLSGFFSGSEAALLSLSKLKVRQLLEKKRAGAIYVKRLKDEPQRMLSTILIGNNLVNVAASAIATSIAISIFKDAGVGIAIGVITFLILVFGEITPKSIAAQHNERTSLIVARPLWYLSVILTPILDILDAIIGRITNTLGITQRKTKVTEEDVIGMLKAAEEEGTIKEIEKQMINKIFEFDDINVKEIMTPRPYIASIPLKSKLKDALNVISNKKYSRLPVYKKLKDNIVGTIYYKDILSYIKDKKLDTPIEKIMKKPYFVPESKKIGSLLKQFQKRKEHMAIVVNEHGSTTGLVTIEDVVEEIVGEIIDEAEKIDPNIKSINAKTWFVKGKTDIEEINEKLKMNIKGEDFDTISGFIFNYIGKIPKEDEEIIFGEFTLKIEELRGNRISKIRIVKK